MGTHAQIGFLNDDGSILSAYCHLDGYPSYTGVKLLEKFNTPKAALDLVMGGDMEVIWDKNLQAPVYWKEGPSRSGSIKDFYKILMGRNYAYLFIKDNWCLIDNMGGDDIQGVAISLI